MSSARQPPKSTLDGLPKQFVSAMRTLFDIMDDRRTGYVKFSDIESRWKDDGTRELPKGVVDSLRKVTPPNGLLSFERFCAGLKICLLRHRASTPGDEVPVPAHRTRGLTLLKISNQPSSMRPSSVPLPERPDALKIAKAPAMATVLRPNSAAADRLAEGGPIPLHPRVGHINTATVRPNNAMAQQRATSLPLLQQSDSSNKMSNETQPAAGEVGRGLRGYKSELRIDVDGSASGRSMPRLEHGPAPIDRSGIMTALHNWRMGVINSEGKGLITSPTIRDGTEFPIQTLRAPVAWARNGITPVQIRHTSKNPDGCEPPRATLSHDVEVDAKQAKGHGPALKKVFNRRREPRRHTVANGIDFNMLKRVKQLEQERDVLLQGLEAVERTKEWYLHQVSKVQDRIHFLGKGTAQPEYSTDAHQERLNLQMTRIFEVNQHLAALIESSEKGFPLHMNLAVRQQPIYARMQQDSAQTVIQRLKEQNRMLTEEVGHKSERITQLEREKSSLIRELFQARSQHRREDDTTFM